MLPLAARVSWEGQSPGLTSPSCPKATPEAASFSGSMSPGRGHVPPPSPQGNQLPSLALVWVFPVEVVRSFSLCLRFFCSGNSTVVWP